DGKEGGKEADEIATKTTQDTTAQVPNLEAEIPKQPRSKRTSGEYVPLVMGYAKDT
ncbi:hypothetical protein KI387_012105, partial [Taxus chinensis]